MIGRRIFATCPRAVYCGQETADVLSFEDVYVHIEAQDMKEHPLFIADQCGDSRSFSQDFYLATLRFPNFGCALH